MKNADKIEEMLTTLRAVKGEQELRKVTAILKTANLLRTLAVHCADLQEHMGVSRDGVEAFLKATGADATETVGFMAAAMWESQEGQREGITTAKHFETLIMEDKK